MTDYRIALVTYPDMVKARDLAEIIVKSKLAACVNIIPQVLSIFTWKDRIEEASEVLMLIKTHEKQLQALENQIRQLHPYEVFEFICLPITSGNESYLKWLSDNTAS